MITEAQEAQNRLVEFVTSILPPQSTFGDTTGQRNPRAGG